jgi:hypothetical protein
MLKRIKYGLAALLLIPPLSGEAQTISALPSGGLAQSTDWLPAVRSGVTMKVQPFMMPAAGSVLISNGTSSPQGITPINGYCLQAVGSAWMAMPCIFTNTVTYSGSPVNGNLAQFTSASVIAPANLTGDVTTSGGLATTVGKIQGVSVGTPTGTGNVVFSASPTLTGTVSGAAANWSGLVKAENYLPTGGLSTSLPAISSIDGVTSVTLSAENNYIANFFTRSSAVNYLEFANSATGSPLNIFASGSDTNIGIDFFTSGTGSFVFNVGSTDELQISTTATTINNTLTTASPSFSGTVSGAAADWSSTDTATAFIPTGSTAPTNGLFLYGGSITAITNNGHMQAEFVDGGSANYLYLGSAGTGSPPIIAAEGSDSVIDLGLTGSGSGATVQTYGHLQNLHGATSSAPTCGTGCSSVTSGSTDVRGSFVTGTSVTAATLDFGTTWGSTPFCTISTNSTAAVADINTISTSVLTVNFASSLTSASVYYVCIQ